MAPSDTPNLNEVALGAFLEDIGKFMQRAHDGYDALPEQVRSRASVVLPGFKGRSTHWHALWADAFFHALEQRGVAFPAGINANRVRDAAVYHHNPATSLHWLSAEADRLSAGMDRKKKDEAAEEEDGGAVGRPALRRDGFRRTPLRSIFAGIDLGRGDPPDRRRLNHKVAELGPATLAPEPIAGEVQKAAYAEAWPKFFDAFVELCRAEPDPELFHAGLLSLSERFTWAIPSSTIDQPDVPLHDHNKSVAAIASCLHRFHEAHGELHDAAAIQDRARRKFRFLTGDLSGIQSTLFRLAAQQVKGSARILRARSFLMGALVETASLLCRRKLGLPPYCELMAAGGRFVLLVPALAETESAVADIRRSLDSWLRARYYGDLVLNLGLGPAFCGHDLLQDRFGATWAEAQRVAEDAKHRALSTQAMGTLAVTYGADGACPACGVRPASRVVDDVVRCEACSDEYEIGRALPRTHTVLWCHRPLPEGKVLRQISVPGDLTLALLEDSLPAGDVEAWRRVVSGWRVADPAEAGNASTRPAARRFVANYVPRLAENDAQDRRFADLSPDARDLDTGDMMTFEHLAALSREADGKDGALVGRPMLGVLKADVDRLGQVFSVGLGSGLSLGRLATLSRMMDAFFTVVLPDLLRREFPDTYTVYAGGDDLLLIGPWNRIVTLAAALEVAFRAHVGANPSVTLSAAIELCGVSEPLPRAVARAEGRLDQAKDGGRNKVSLIDELPLTWPALARSIAVADQVSTRIRGNTVSTAFLYRCLSFSREKAAAQGEVLSLRAADWRARWAYHLRRQFPGRDNEGELRYFDSLMDSGLMAGGGEALPSAVVPLVIALYRNR
ncbi:type III-A CRISPR-associated protein Cas10/Csm1 [Vineibacter terrae]|uniref:CRISPR system single-strand-specific deoxyribonuclease Cas10/Csm1 (subtype III-A) n=1 Tax=Vineibacter terrae TaxID=2586908 RepID=A0A5C8PW18_9HYPH|nr:type III-A CRISPR-associated protein Cas10/Csm1 [Vineibacter terrae]TXL82059.1 type III-A CRISPR-associated protein Cas10/Csm1 [Vineibacter terrae]